MESPYLYLLYNFPDEDIVHIEISHNSKMNECNWFQQTKCKECTHQSKIPLTLTLKAANLMFVTCKTDSYANEKCKRKE